MTFKKLGLNDNLLKAVESLGFTTPSDIQEKAVPELLVKDTDFVGLAQTGTGKTAAFGLPMLQKINPNKNETQAIILCPTRELCLQISKDLKTFSAFMPKISVTAIYGGVNISTQIKALKSGTQIIVATPGRMLDHLNRRTASLKNIDIVVLDEADEMLNMGFQEDLNQILNATTGQHNTWLFSATMPKEVEAIAKGYMRNPITVESGGRNKSAENIQHQYCVISARDRYFALTRFIDFYPDMFGILFCRTKADTQHIADKLMKAGYNADALHGDLSQKQRDVVMNRFRMHNLQLLVATDVAARGIDVNDVTHVIHYGMPDDIENYTHRSGRTARAGKSGVSLLFMSTRDNSKLKQIEKQIGKKFERVLVPKGMEICGKQLYNFIHTAHNVKVDEQGLAPFMQQVYQEFTDMPKEEVIKRLLSLEFNKYIERYSNVADIESDYNLTNEGRDKHKRNEKKGRKNDRNSKQRKNSGEPDIFINIGKKDLANKGQFINYICKTAGISGEDIGRINFMDTNTFFGVVSQDVANQVLRKFKGKSLNNRKLRVDMADNKRR